MSKRNLISYDDSGFVSMLTILFIGLKLTDLIDWSWWWVLSPIWISTTLSVIIVTLIFWLKSWQK